MQKSSTTFFESLQKCASDQRKCTSNHFQQRVDWKWEELLESKKDVLWPSGCGWLSSPSYLTPVSPPKPITFRYCTWLDPVTPPAPLPCLTLTQIAVNCC